MANVKSGDPELEVRQVVHDWHLAWGLYALWDNGFFEYIDGRDSFRAEEFASTRSLDAELVAVTFDYLVGHRLLTRSDAVYTVTDRLRSWTSVFARGVLDLYVGGYGRSFAELAPMMRGEAPRTAGAETRNLHKAAAGTYGMSGRFLLPKIVEAIADTGARCVLDLGCGTGELLLRLAATDESFQGVGVDLSATSIEGAKGRARADGVDGRLRYFQGEVGAGDLPLPAEVVAEVDTITALFLLHEFGRNESIQAVIRGLAKQLPGRRFCFVEVVPLDIDALSHTPPRHLGQLDYLFVHPVSNQGPPLSPGVWQELLEGAGAREVSSRSLALGAGDAKSDTLRIYSCTL